MFQEVLHQQPESKASQSPSTSQLCKYTLILTNPTGTTFNLQRNHHPPTLTGWWLNHPIWKICSSNWKSSPIFGVNFLKIFETICHHLSDTPGELQIFETNPAKFPFFLMVQPHQASEATNPRLLASDHSDLMHSKLLPNKDCPAHWQPRKTAHEQKNTHFVTREQILRVVFFSTPHQKKKRGAMKLYWNSWNKQ